MSSIPYPHTANTAAHRISSELAISCAILNILTYTRVSCLATRYLHLGCYRALVLQPAISARLHYTFVACTRDSLCNGPPGSSAATSDSLSGLARGHETIFPSALPSLISYLRAILFTFLSRGNLIRLSRDPIVRVPAATAISPPPAELGACPLRPSMPRDRHKPPRG